MGIKRYLDPERFKNAKKDLPPLVGLINRSLGEYSLQLRENYFNIYYQGNSLAKVIPNKNGTYSAEIHKKFLQLDTPDKILEKLEQYSKKNTRKNRHYIYFSRIKPEDFHRFFCNDHLKMISDRIQEVGYGEEITFEQVLIADNPPSEEFIVIDRQIAAHGNRPKVDLLALKRASVDKPFHFLVIEVKLGKNPELHEKVCGQLKRYMDHIRENIKVYVDCYKENYRQKKELGLLDSSLPKNIEIDEHTVEGLIFVGVYSERVKKALEHLCKEIKGKGWDINVQWMRNEIRMDNRSDCEELLRAT